MRFSILLVIALTLPTIIQSQPIEWEDYVLDASFLPDPKVSLCSPAAEVRQRCVSRSVGVPDCWEFVGADAGDSCLFMEPGLSAHPIMVMSVSYSRDQERSEVIDSFAHMKAVGESDGSVWHKLYHEDQGKLLGHSFITRQYVLVGPKEYILILNGIWERQAGGPADLGASEIISGVIEDLTQNSTGDLIQQNEIQADPKMSLGMAQVKYALMLMLIYKEIESGDN